MTNVLSLPQQNIWMETSIPIDGKLRNLLKTLFCPKDLEKITSITPKQILFQTIKQIFFQTKTKSEFVKDPAIQRWLATKDANLLSEYYEFIKSCRNLLATTSIDSHFIGETELESIGGESAEKFAYHLYERISTFKSITDALNGNSLLPPTMLLNDFTEEEFSLLYAISGKLSINNLQQALQTIQLYSLDINSVSSGTDRMTLILPEAKNPLTRQIQKVTLLNTNCEFKLNLAEKLDRRSLLVTEEKMMKGNENDRLLMGQIDEYPYLISTRGRYFMEGIGLGRIDRLARDWNKLKTALEINGNLFNTFPTPSDEFRHAVAKIKFGIEKNLTETQTNLANRIIAGFLKKIQNSIAQHQMIEFMRSGRWFEPKDLGIGFPAIKSSFNALINAQMSMLSFASLATANIGDRHPKGIICLPLKDSKGKRYNGIIDRNTLFYPQTLEDKSRFGIIKHLDQKGFVRKIPNPDLFSFKLKNTKLFSRAPLKGNDLIQFREYQKNVYELIFQTPNQGHETNFIHETWMPEVNVLIYAGATTQEIKSLLLKLKKDYPITYNLCQGFDISHFKLKWKKGTSIVKRRKIIECTNNTQSNLYETTTRSINRIEYTNTSVPIKGITSYKTLFNIILKNKTNIKQLPANQIISAFEKLPIAHRSFSNLGLPSPLGGLTVEPFAGQEPPIPLLEIFECTLDEKSIAFIPFRPPTPSFKDDRLLINAKLEPKTATILLNKLKNNTTQGYFLGSYFNEIKNYLDKNTISDLKQKYNTTSVEIAMINEIKAFANGRQNLLTLNFKKELSHLKHAFLFNANENQPTVADIRILPGHFPMYPANIDPHFKYTRPFKLKRSYGNEILFHQNNQYQPHIWLEAQLRRILYRLTINNQLYLQNIEMWNNAMVSNAVTNMPFKKILSKNQISFLAKKFLAPKKTIAFEFKTQKMKIIGGHDRVFKHGAFLTPVFMKSHKNNLKEKIEITIKNIKNHNNIINAIKKSQIPFRTLRIMFE